MSTYTPEPLDTSGVTLNKAKNYVTHRVRADTGARRADALTQIGVCEVLQGWVEPDIVF